MIWALIPCTKTKVNRPCVAQEMYRPSALFRGAWETATAAGQNPLILSAKYGLLVPSTPIEPYDKTLIGAPRHERAEWAEGVLACLRLYILPGDSFVSYLGRAYGDFLLPRLRNEGYPVDEPLLGLGQGARLHWFAERRRSA